MMKFLVWYIAGFMSSLGIVCFYAKCVGNKILSKKIISAFILGIMITSFIKCKDYMYVSILSYFIIHPLLFSLISKDKSIRIYFYYALVIWIYGALFDFLTMVIISLVNIKIPINMEAEWFKTIPSMFALIFFIISSYIPALRKFTNKTVGLLGKIKYSNFLLITFFIFTLVGGVSIAINMENFSLSFLIYVLITLVIVIFIFIFHFKNIDYEFNILVKTLKANNAFYTNINDEYSIFKHNLTARLLSVESVSNKKARVLINDLISEFNSDTDYHKLILNLPYGLDGVINQKLNAYKDKLEIKVSNNLSYDIFDILSPKRYNVLVEKLSLLLDNAIEASTNSRDKILIINLYDEDNILKIEIKNTFSGAIDIDNIGKKHYSSKGNKHGLGLYSMFRSNEVSVNVKIVNDYFVSEVMAKFNEK